MKRYATFLICLVVLISGCSFSSKRIKEPVNFYYPRNEIQYHKNTGVIGWEIREVSGHRDNLSYLLALYRLGPSSEDLRLPFPEGTAILMMEQTDTYIHLALGSNAAAMSDAELSLASACLTLTCTELTQVEHVTVTNGDRSVTMSRNSLTLIDTSMLDTMEEAQ